MMSHIYTYVESDTSTSNHSSDIGYSLNLVQRHSHHLQMCIRNNGRPTKTVVTYIRPPKFVEIRLAALKSLSLSSQRHTQ